MCAIAFPEPLIRFGFACACATMMKWPASQMIVRHVQGSRTQIERELQVQ
jgi:hypothetical protein